MSIWELSIRFITNSFYKYFYFPHSIIIMIKYLAGTHFNQIHLLGNFFLLMKLWAIWNYIRTVPDRCDNVVDDQHLALRDLYFALVALTARNLHCLHNIPVHRRKTNRSEMKTFCDFVLRYKTTVILCKL